MPQDYTRSGLRHVHAGGYSAGNAQKLKSQELPEKTKCDMCHRLKNITAFSNKQQDILRSGLATGRIRDLNHAKSEWIKCSQCHGQQNELQCSSCYTWKGLEGFSKRQRTMKDDACCLSCVAELENDEPIPQNPLRAALDELVSDSSDESDNDYMNDTGSMVTNPYEERSESGQSGVRLPLEHLSLRDSASRSSAAASSTGSYQTMTGSGKENVRKGSVVSSSTVFDPENSAMYYSVYDENANNPYIEKDPNANKKKSKAAMAFANEKDNRKPRRAQVPVPDYDAGRNVSYGSDDDNDDDEDVRDGNWL